MALFEGATQYDGSCAKVLRALRDRMQAREKAVAGKPCPADMPTVQPRLIGWRMADYTAETEDAETARNWSANVPVLPIFEGDPNTKLMAASQGPKA
jgi:hypothetical protein